LGTSVFTEFDFFGTERTRLEINPSENREKSI
jgi:hypothetical protein